MSPTRAAVPTSRSTAIVAHTPARIVSTVRTSAISGRDSIRDRAPQPSRGQTHRRLRHIRRVCVPDDGRSTSDTARRSFTTARASHTAQNTTLSVVSIVTVTRLSDRATLRFSTRSKPTNNSGQRVAPGIGGPSHESLRTTHMMEEPPTRLVEPRSHTNAQHQISGGSTYWAGLFMTVVIS